MDTQGDRIRCLTLETAERLDRSGMVLPRGFHLTEKTTFLPNGQTDSLNLYIHQCTFCSSQFRVYFLPNQNLQFLKHSLRQPRHSLLQYHDEHTKQRIKLFSIDTIRTRVNMTSI